jgi:uncharacterized protein YuzE
MTVKIDDLLFDRVKYDAEDDVLYLGRGTSNVAADGAATPEGHALRYDIDGQVIGVTIVNAKWLLDRDGYLKITMPHEVRVQPGELAAALS